MQQKGDTKKGFYNCCAKRTAKCGKIILGSFSMKIYKNAIKRYKIEEKSKIKAINEWCICWATLYSTAFVPV